jgi:hypothetical protein
MTARLVGGGPLKMQEIGPASRAFGISPKTATGAADLLLRPSTADPDMAMKPGQGNWDSVTLRLERRNRACRKPPQEKAIFGVAAKQGA